MMLFYQEFKKKRRKEDRKLREEKDSSSLWGEEFLFVPILDGYSRVSLV